MRYVHEEISKYHVWLTLCIQRYISLHDGSATKRDICQMVCASLKGIRDCFLKGSDAKLIHRKSWIVTNVYADLIDLPLQPEASQRVAALRNAELNLPPVVPHFRNEITDTIHRMRTGQNPLIPVVAIQKRELKNKQGGDS